LVGYVGDEIVVVFQNVLDEGTEKVVEVVDTELVSRADESVKRAGLARTRVSEIQTLDILEG